MDEEVKSSADTPKAVPLPDEEVKLERESRWKRFHNRKLGYPRCPYSPHREGIKVCETCDPIKGQPPPGLLELENIDSEERGTLLIFTIISVSNFRYSRKEGTNMCFSKKLPFEAQRWGGVVAVIKFSY